MTEHLNPELSQDAPDSDEQERLRRLSRSPHPYHHQSRDLPHPADRFVLAGGASQPIEVDNEYLSPTAYPPVLKDPAQSTSDSGSEADDEHLWKGLPAPKTKPHKGLRGRDEQLSGISTPLYSPASPDADDVGFKEKALAADSFSEPRLVFEVIRRRRIIARRATEAGIVMTLGVMVASNPDVSQLLATWGRGMHPLVLSSYFRFI